MDDGGDVAKEWPRWCQGWKECEELDQFVEQYQLYTADFDGCCVGVKDHKDQPILKPWRVITSHKGLAESLTQLRCKDIHGNKLHESHAPCAGGNTKKTGFYTESLAKTVLNAVYPNSVAAMTVKAVNKQEANATAHSERAINKIIDIVVNR